MKNSQVSVVATQHRMEKPILNRIPYRGNHPGADGIIDYVIVRGNQCIFSGITRNSTSTINAAEQVIEAICQREEFEPSEIEFFDLKTCQGYNFNLEHYEFSNLVLKLDSHGRVKDVDWNWLDCPTEIVEIFKEHIGTYTVALVSWSEAVAQGFGSEENRFHTYETVEAAERSLRFGGHCHQKPNDTHTWVIVDLATKPEHVIENGRRYETRVKFTDPDEVRESRYELKSMAETRARIVQYKNHALNEEELKDLAELFHHELARWNGKPHSCLRSSMEMFMRVYVCILNGNDTPDHLLGCFIPGALGIIANLCQTMPGFREHALAKGTSSSESLETAVAAIAKKYPYTGDEPPLISKAIN